MDDSPQKSRRSKSEPGRSRGRRPLDREPDVEELSTVGPKVTSKLLSYALNNVPSELKVPPHRTDEKNITIEIFLFFRNRRPRD